ncbi:MAG: hypothetical protein IK990_17025 [Ruminiclostridium sp.]|nr:hypothetical protein [Ruminiclostridium sp.]
MPRSEAQKRAEKKYQQSEKFQYTTIAARLKKDMAAQIQKTAEEKGLSVSRYLLLSAKYCMENNIDIKDE